MTLLRIHDAHTHVWSSPLPYPDLAPAPNGGAVVDLLSVMDGAGVQAAAIVTPGAMGWDNSATLAAACAHPKRFVPVGRVDIQDPGAVHQLLDDIAQGLRGIRVGPVSDAPLGALLEPSAERLWHTMADAGLSVAVHSSPDQLPYVSAFAKAHPELSLLLDHLGRPDVATGVSDARFHATLSLSEHENVVVKTPNAPFFSRCGPPFADLAPFIEAAVRRFGADRVMWGSDWPGSVATTEYRSTFEPTLTFLAERSEHERQLVLGGNFERIYRLDH